MSNFLKKTQLRLANWNDTEAFENKWAKHKIKRAQKAIEDGTKKTQDYLDDGKVSWHCPPDRRLLSAASKRSTITHAINTCGNQPQLEKDVQALEEGLSSWQAGDLAKTCRHVYTRPSYTRQRQFVTLCRQVEELGYDVQSNGRFTPRTTTASPNRTPIKGASARDSKYSDSGSDLPYRTKRYLFNVNDGDRSEVRTIAGEQLEGWKALDAYVRYGNITDAHEGFKFEPFEAALRLFARNFEKEPHPDLMPQNGLLVELRALWRDLAFSLTPPAEDALGMAEPSYNALFDRFVKLQEPCTQHWQALQTVCAQKR